MDAHKERERYHNEREQIMSHYDKEYELVTKNLVLARRIRDECKQNGTLEKFESRQYHVDFYYGREGIKAGIVMYKGVRNNGESVLIMSTRSGLGGQTMRVWKRSETP